VISPKPTSGPRSRGPADFEYTEGFCSVWKISDFTLFLSRLQISRVGPL
jgi:hypothetical protein